MDLDVNKTEKLMFDGKYDEVLLEINKFLSYEKLDEEQRLKILLFKAKILLRKNEKQESLQILNKLLNESSDNSLIKIDTYIALENIHSFLFQYDKILEMVKNGETALESLIQNENKQKLDRCRSYYLSPPSSLGKNSEMTHNNFKLT